MGSSTLMELIIKDARRTFLVFFLAAIGMISVALFMEYFLELKPCILCYMQRGAVIVIGILAAIGFLINPSRLLNYKIFISIISLSIIAGMLLSARQLYLQSLPAELVPSCAPDIEYLISTLPFLEVVILAFTGDGNCAEVLWTFLGISIPGWVFISLSILISYCLFIFKNVNEIHSHK